jgi:RNA polymerase sigma factor (TIGR02999 family)
VSAIEFRATRQADRAGDAGASDRLFAMFYDELRRMAQRELRRNAATTLTPTTLLHETFLNVSQRESAAFDNSGQFMSYTACAMRGLIISHLRTRKAQKRGGEFAITTLPAELPHPEEAASALSQLEALNEALQALIRVDARLAECVDLKFFCGLSFEEIASMRGVSTRTVRRDWNKARVLLIRLIDGRADFLRSEHLG